MEIVNNGELMRFDKGVTLVLNPEEPGKKAPPR
jgi:hypothetical protein